MSSNNGRIHSDREDSTEGNMRSPPGHSLVTWHFSPSACVALVLSWNLWTKEWPLPWSGLCCVEVPAAPTFPSLDSSGRGRSLALCLTYCRCQGEFVDWMKDLVQRLVPLTNSTLFSWQCWWYSLRAFVKITYPVCLFAFYGIALLKCSWGRGWGPRYCSYQFRDYGLLSLCVSLLKDWL